MDTGSDAPENPAVVADVEQHAREEIAGIKARVGARAVGYARALAVIAGIVVSGWLIQRWRRRR